MDIDSILEKVKYYFGFDNNYQVQFEDALNEKVNYFLLGSLIGLISAIVLLFMIGICYDCYNCSTNRRVKSGMARSTSITYQGFSADLELPTIGPADDKPRTSTFMGRIH